MTAKNLFKFEHLLIFLFVIYLSLYYWIIRLSIYIDVK